MDPKVAEEEAIKTHRVQRYADSSPVIESHANQDLQHDYKKVGESDLAYFLRVYGNSIYDVAAERSDSFRRLSTHISSELACQQSSMQEQLPDTPRGWAALLSTITALLIGYEINLQRKLTCPPTVYGQIAAGPLKAIYERMTSDPSSILLRTIQPSLLVGTRGALSSAAAYWAGGPTRAAEHLHFREVMTMTQDGAKVAMDWELPLSAVSQREVLKGPIKNHVVLILHGINNHANFGYIRSLKRAVTNRGWIAAGFNFRGCGGEPMTTPRGYTGAYTGDIRCTVHRIAARLDKGAKLFLVGNSLGANLVTKYLGEEGNSGTLPDCVVGGVALGNVS
jgi:hypothetical protein